MSVPLRCPRPQSIIALCEEKMQFTSSCRLCRSLSAVGRRVLSLESFGAFQGKHTRRYVLAHARSHRHMHAHTDPHVCTFIHVHTCTHRCAH